MTMTKPARVVRNHRHIDPVVRRSLDRLLEALDQFERVTTRQATVIVVPHRHDEPTVVWESGETIVGGDPVERARNAVRAREESALGDSAEHVGGNKP